MKSLLISPLLLGLVVAISACTPSGEERQADDMPYHHLSNGRFRNLSDSPVQTSTLGDFLPFLLGRLRQEFLSVTPPVDHVLDAAAVQAGLERLADQDHLTWLGHAAFLIQLDGVKLITDPYLGKHAGPFSRFGPARYVPAALTPETLPPLDLILVSHNHYDHLDEATIEALPNKDRVTVVVPLQLGSFFTARGYRNVIELDWHQSATIRGIAVTAVPAAHFSRRGAFDKNRSLWAGFVIEGRDKKIFFSGDTGYAPPLPGNWTTLRSR